MTITALPSPPTSSMSQAAFIAAADAFVAALATWTTEVNAAAAAFGVTMWVSGTTYALGDRVWSPIDSQTYRRIVAGAGTTDPSADGTNWAVLTIPAATQAQQETGSSLGLAVTPGRQQYHASAAKAWCRFNSTGTVAAGYNVSSVTDNGGAGDWTINFTTAFSSVNYACAFAFNNVTSDVGANMKIVSNPGVSAVNVQKFENGSLADSTINTATFFGDQ